MAEDRAAGSAYRMEPLATLPVFFKLQGKLVVMAGGTPPAVWKAELLAAAGATVRIYAESPCQALVDLAAASPPETITIVARHWVPDDLGRAAMALGALDDDNEAEAFRDAAKRMGVPVNVIDKPAFCDFQFGTIVTRSPLVVGISTNGAAPVFGQALRTRIEAILPHALRDWAQAAKAWRGAVQARALDFAARRRFWETFAQRALDAGELKPTLADREACFDAVDRRACKGSSAIPVAFVGTGAGFTASTTLEAVASLQSADVIFHDADVSRAAIGLARREADKRSAPDTPVQLLEQAVPLLGERLRVAVVGTGNPFRCRRWRLRAEAFAAVGQPVTLVAGLDRCPTCSERCLSPAG